jgi:hypothetical protein
MLHDERQNNQAAEIELLPSSERATGGSETPWKTVY